MEHRESILMDEKLKNAELEGEGLLLQLMFLIVRELNCTLKKDGNQWCYIHGDMPENYIAGFGRTPKAALIDFYNSWESKKW